VAAAQRGSTHEHAGPGTAR